MAGLPSEVDVAVIGAGAAGIAAGRCLAEAKRASFVVLEARERPGGRAWTIEKDGLPLDLGCEWLHSADRNPLAPLAESLGFSIYRRRPDWTTRLRRSGETEEAEADWIARARGALLGGPSRRPGVGRSAGFLRLTPGGRWNALFDAISTWANAVELEDLSFNDNDRYQDSGINWRVREGTEVCSRRSPRGCRSPTMQPARESRMADGVYGWKPPRHGRGFSRYRDRADRM